jgi:outer membrane protein
VEAAKQSAKTAWRGVIVAQSEFWPDLSIEHNQYERREGFQSNLDWDFLFKINVPLFQGGETFGGFKKSVSLWKQEKLNYSLVKRQAELEIKESYQNWKASLEEARSLKEAVQASEENFRLQKEEYAHNLVNNLDVLEALELLHETRRDANRAHYQMKQNYWQLMVAAGELDLLLPSVALAEPVRGSAPRHPEGRRPEGSHTRFFAAFGGSE